MFLKKICLVKTQYMISFVKSHFLIDQAVTFFSFLKKKKYIFFSFFQQFIVRDTLLITLLCFKKSRLKPIQSYGM